MEHQRATEEPGPQPPPAFGQVTSGGGEGRGTAGLGDPECPRRERLGAGEQLGGSPHLEQSGQAGNNPVDYVCARAQCPPPPALHILRYSLKTSNPRAAPAALTPALALAGRQPPALCQPAPPGPGMPCGVGRPPAMGNCTKTPERRLPKVRPPCARPGGQEEGGGSPGSVPPLATDTYSACRMGSRALVLRSLAPATPRTWRRRHSPRRCRITRCCRGWWGQPASSCGRASPSPSWYVSPLPTHPPHRAPRCRPRASGGFRAGSPGGSVGVGATWLFALSLSQDRELRPEEIEGEEAWGRGTGRGWRQCRR